MTSSRTMREAEFLARLLQVSALCVIGLAIACRGADVTVTGLRCEYAVNPLGIDTTEPHLSWRLESAMRGQKQTAYQVLVSASSDALRGDEGDLWDSGKVPSGQSQHVAYSGKPLLSRLACYWKVRVWGQDGTPSAWSTPARWTMGLLDPADWSAQWISAPATQVVAVDNGELTVQKATYRTLDGSVAVDVTDIVRKELAKKKPLVVHFRTLGGDPARDVVKELVVEYVRDGKPGIARANDFKTMDLFGSGMTGIPANALPTPQFRKDFRLDAAPSSALITVHSPAYFELYVNGEKIGKDVLSPAVSKLDEQTFSLTYDVSEHLKAGENCVGLWLGMGWAASIVFRAQLDAVVNGERLIVGTDTSWKTRTSNRHKIGLWKWGDFGGEQVDARQALPGWCEGGLNTVDWDNAVAANSPQLGPARTQPCPPNRIGEVIPAASISTIGPGLYEVDFGTALTGWFWMKMPVLEPGTTVTMTFADSRSDSAKQKLTKIGDSSWYQHFSQISTFISAGGEGEVFQHKFNYAAFRYVIIEGLSSPPPEDSVSAMLIDSDLEEVGSFECSNDLLNRIHEVNKWTQRCLDLGGYYVDCPHRERMGYGDGQVATEGFMTNFRADGFYRKWLADWRGLQKPDGGLPNSAPFGKGGGGPGWGGLLSAITWRHYLYYGDRRVLEENYDAIRRYVENLESISQKNGDILTGKTGRFSFIGDWVAPRKGMDTKNAPSHEARQIFNNCYRINQIEILAQMARVLGKTNDVSLYSKLLNRIRPKIHEAFYDAEKQEYVIDEQAYYVMPLMTRVVPDAIRPILLAKLEKNILEKNRGHLDTGMLGTYFMMEYLRGVGRSDLAYTMFTQTACPGWGYMLEQGATAFWEQWNGYWSRLHSCFTSPGNWLYQGLAGIQADPAAPGFKNVIIKPDIVGDVAWMRAHHDSPYGRIVSNWTLGAETLTIEVTIPPNSTATVYVPAGTTTDVVVNGHVLEEADQVTLLRMEKRRAVLGVGSGSYVISSPR